MSSKNERSAEPDRSSNPDEGAHETAPADAPLGSAVQVLPSCSRAFRLRFVVFEEAVT